jgi:hypothetical protein
MSDKIWLQVYYGQGEILHGPNGVDLSMFGVIQKQVTSPGEKSFTALYKWLLRILQIDGSIYNLNVRGLFSRSTDYYFWELVPINSTETWKNYVDFCFGMGLPLVLLVDTEEVEHVGVEEADDQDKETENIGGEGACEIGTSSENRERGPIGQADEAEVFTELVEQMERDDMETEEVDEDDSSDEENDTHPPIPVPAEWRNVNYDTFVANEGYRAPYQSRPKVVTQQDVYPTKLAVMQAVQEWSFSLRRKFYVKYSTTKLYEVTCRQSGCPFRVRAAEGKWSKQWKCSNVVDHTCEIQELEMSHRNLTSEFVANHMYSSIVDNLRYEPKSIIRQIQLDFQYTISYSKAWRAKQKAIEKRFGTFEASYDNLPDLLRTLARRNIGTYIDVMEYPDPSRPGKKILHRAMFSLGACINAFRHCPPVICVDGTFLTGKYKGQILTAIGVDGGNHVLPLAFAFVEGENTDSWYWFLERVRYAVVQGRPNVCVISDRHAGLLQAIKELKEGSSDRQRAAFWPDIESRWCIRHLGANFYRQFRNKDLMNFFKSLCVQNQQRKFDFMWQKLDELTSKYSEVSTHSARKQAEDAPVSLCAIPTDKSGTRRRSGRNTKNFSQWIENEPKEKWAMLYDTNGARHGITTSNLAEVYNSVLRGHRALPLVAIVEAIVYNTTQYFVDRFKIAEATVANTELVYSAHITNYMSKRIEKAKWHNARRVGTMQHRFEVRCKERFREGVNRVPVVQECQLDYNGVCSCTCMKPYLLHRPCSHVIAACALTNMSLKSFVSPYYFKEALMATWSGEIYGSGIVGQFITNRGHDYRTGPDLSKLRQKPGRRRTRRIKNDMDESETGKRTRRCSICNATNHTYKNCPGARDNCANEAGPSGDPSDGRQPPPSH